MFQRPDTESTADTSTTLAGSDLPTYAHRGVRMVSSRVALPWLCQFLEPFPASVDHLGDMVLSGATAPDLIDIDRGVRVGRLVRNWMCSTSMDGRWVVVDTGLCCTPDERKTQWIRAMNVLIG